MCRRSRGGNSCIRDQLEDLKHVGKIRNWKKVAQNRDSWKKVVEQARTFLQVVALYKEEEKINQTRTKHDNNKNTSKFQSRLINLTNILYYLHVQQ